MGTLTKTTDELNEIIDNNGAPATNYRFNDGVFQIKNTTDEKYHTIWCENVAGNATLKIAITGES